MPKTKPLNHWELSDLIPPVLARLLAREPWGPPLSDLEIATGSGLTQDEVFWLQLRTNWVGVDVPTQRKFLQGCRVDFCNYEQMKRVRSYLASRPSWKYLRKSPDWKTKFEPLLKLYRKSLNP